MSFIRVDRVWKEFGQTPVLERVNLEVAEGDFLTIVGASGCGKTTFLRMLLGIEEPSRGAITLEGKPLEREPSKSRGVVFQKYSVFPHMTVLNNVVVAHEFAQCRWLGRAFGSKRKEMQRDAEQMLARVGLSHAVSLYPHSLSGGMQQRLALAQALIATPRVLLLDEPFGALDPGIRTDMQALVLQLQRESGLTVFMITHDISEAFLLGNRVLVFDKVRHDPDGPDLFGSTITFDIPAADHSEQLAGNLQESITEVPPEPPRKLAGVA